MHGTSIKLSLWITHQRYSFSSADHTIEYYTITVKHFLFARTLFSRKFSRPVTRENKVHANISHVSIIVQEMNNRENKVNKSKVMSSRK